MGQEDERSTAAAVSVFPDDENMACLEGSTTSKKAWRRSLGRGCLNKSVNEKLRLYSQVRALSSKRIEKYNQPPATLPAADLTKLAAGDIEDVQDTVSHLEPSPVLLEDFSQPPEAIEEKAPMFFTPQEFFHFLRSSDWTEEICLRVIGGELLTLLLKALYTMEKQRQLHTHVVYANLNSRQKAPAPDEIIQEEMGLPKIKEDITGTHTVSHEPLQPKTYEPAKGWEYEKMVVELVFYEKPDLSNITYVIDETNPSPDKKYVPMSINVLRPPYALKEHTVTRVRLPASENVKIKTKIEQLEAEKEALEMKLHGINGLTLTTQQQPPPPPPPVNQSRGSEEIEWIAEEPLFVDGNAQEIKVPLLVTKSAPEVSGGLGKSASVAVTTVTSPYTKEDETKADISMRLDTDEDTTKHEVISSTLSRDAEVVDISDDFDLLLARESSLSTRASFKVIKSVTELMSETEEEPVMQRLNLTRNELYVTGLYNPREENRLGVQEKLRKSNRARLKLRRETEQKLFQKAEARAQNDIYSSFKTLAVKREAARIKATTPDVWRMYDKTVEDPKPKVAEDTWTRYQKEQEEVEMDSALVNKLEKGILERRKTVAQSSRKDSGPGKKSMSSEPKGRKNKSKNNRSQSISKMSPRNSASKASALSGSYRTRALEPFTDNANTSASNSARGQYVRGTNSPCYAKISPSHSENLKLTSSKDATYAKSGNRYYARLLSMLVRWRLYVDRGVCFQAANNQAALYKGMKNIFLGNKNRSHLLDPLVARKAKLKRAASPNLPPLKPYAGKINKSSSSKCSQLSKGDRRQERVRMKSQSFLNTNQNSLDFAIPEQEETASSLNASVAGRMSGVSEGANTGSRAVVIDDDFKDGPAYAESEDVIDTLPEDLRCYTYECACDECKGQAMVLAHLRPPCLMQSCPLLLGRLRTDFRFLKFKDYTPLENLRTVSHFADITVLETSKLILELIHTVMIRKEILTSSFGHTYTTVTFTKGSVFKTMSNFDSLYA